MKVLQRMAAAGTAVALSLLCSCGGNPQKTVPEGQPTATSTPESQPTTTGVSESPNVTVESGNKGSYAEAYCEVLRYLLDQHGYHFGEFAGLADLERDGVPELIVGYLGRVSVFRYDSGVVRELLNVPYDTRLECWGDDYSEYLYLKTDGEQPFLMVTDCDNSDEGYIERASIFTLEKGALQCRTGVGLADGKDGEYLGDFCYIYTACQIDGKTAPVDEYVRFVDLHAQEAWAMWTTYVDGDHDEEAKENQAALQAFLDELTTQAGVEKIDLADYAEAKKQRKAAPYEGEPYVLGDVREEAAKLTPPTPTDDVLKEYQAAERTLLAELVTQYWWSGFNPFTMSFGGGGFGYEKVDFDNDGLPEIVVSYSEENATIYCVYHYADGCFVEALRCEEAWGECLDLGDWNHQYFTLCDWRTDERGIDHELYYLFQNGTFACADFAHDSDINGNKIYTVNGEVVSPEAYEEALRPYEPHDYLLMFYIHYFDEDELRSLAASLGMSPEEIDQLLGASQ